MRVNQIFVGFRSDGPAAQPAVYEEPCLQAIFVPERLQRSIALVSETALTDSIVLVC